MTNEEAHEVWMRVNEVRISAKNQQPLATEAHMDGLRKLLVRFAPDWGSPS